MYCQGSAQGYPCLENDYNRMDDIFKKELALKISVDDIVNQSNFCTSIAIDIVKELEADKDFLNLNKYLKGLSGKMGIYHLWVDADVFCQDHEKYLMECVYVGKGYAENRVMSHIKDKWSDALKIYISFYECENRIAKYLEQLFLDTYSFALNKEENPGEGILYAKWDEERYDIGTELNLMADLLP